MNTKLFLYHQRHRVILYDATGEYFTRRYEQVYTKNLIAHKGTDNQIMFEFVNQDQKRVDLTGKAFTCRLMSHSNEELLLVKQLVIINEIAGQTKLVLTESELDKLPAGLIGFSIEVDNGTGLFEPVYVDDHAGGRGTVEVVNSITPKFVVSTILDIPDHGINPVYVSSLLTTKNSDLHTFQIDMDEFTGEIIVQGATDLDGEWYTLETLNLTAANMSLFNLTGFHPHVRFSISEVSGTITSIKYR